MYPKSSSSLSMTKNGILSEKLAYENIFFYARFNSYILVNICFNKREGKKSKTWISNQFVRFLGPKKALSHYMEVV